MPYDAPGARSTIAQHAPLVMVVEATTWPSAYRRVRSVVLTTTAETSEPVTPQLRTSTGSCVSTGWAADAGDPPSRSSSWLQPLAPVTAAATRTAARALVRITVPPGTYRRSVGRRWTTRD